MTHLKSLSVKLGVVVLVIVFPILCYGANMIARMGEYYLGQDIKTVRGLVEFTPDEYGVFQSFPGWFDLPGERIFKAPEVTFNRHLWYLTIGALNGRIYNLALQYTNNDRAVVDSVFEETLRFIKSQVGAPTEQTKTPKRYLWDSTDGSMLLVKREAMGLWCINLLLTSRAVKGYEIISQSSIQAPAKQSSSSDLGGARGKYTDAMRKLLNRMVTYEVVRPLTSLWFVALKTASAQIAFEIKKHHPEALVLEKAAVSKFATAYKQAMYTLAAGDIETSTEALSVAAGAASTIQPPGLARVHRHYLSLLLALHEVASSAGSTGWSGAASILSQGAGGLTTPESLHFSALIAYAQGRTVDAAKLLSQAEELGRQRNDLVRDWLAHGLELDVNPTTEILELCGSLRAAAEPLPPRDQRTR